VDPVTWEASQRMGKCLVELPNGEYLPEMSERERERVATLRQTFEEAAKREMELPDSSEGQ
jgi:hypothetical protein